jgi:hypothetical protein
MTILFERSIQFCSLLDEGLVVASIIITIQFSNDSGRICPKKKSNTRYRDILGRQEIQWCSPERLQFRTVALSVSQHTELQLFQ